MTAKRVPGPICILKSGDINDGTLCRCQSPLPGPVSDEPSQLKNFRWPLGTPDGTPYEEEGWFEHRYPNLLEDTRRKFVKLINDWVQTHWGERQFQDQKQRINVYARGVNRNDDRFKGCGDTPQTPWEADRTLGAFSIDLVTPVNITYSYGEMSGRTVKTFQWSAVMYVQDVLGLQADNNIIHDFSQVGIGLDRLLLWSAPSRAVKRAQWEIQGEGVYNRDLPEQFPVPPESWHKVVAGDTLSKLSEKYYKDLKLWQLLYEVNKGQIGNDPNLLKVGLWLCIPDFNKVREVLEKMKNLPPTLDLKNLTPK